MKCDGFLVRNVLSLKHYDGDVEDLDLNFTAVVSEFGQSKVCPHTTHFTFLISMNPPSPSKHI